MPPVKYAPGVNAALFKALAHPVKGQIMVILDERPASPSRLAELLGEKLDVIARHVRELAKTPGPDEPPLIELVGTEEHRGGTRHIYKAVARPVIEGYLWVQLSKLIREVNSVWVAQIWLADLEDFLVDLRESFETRTFDDDGGRVMLRMNVVLDAEGVAELEPGAEAWLEHVQDVQARSLARLADSEEPGQRYSTMALAFEHPSPD